MNFIQNYFQKRTNIMTANQDYEFAKELINALEKNQIRLNRKILADLSVNDKKVFQEIIKKASG